MLQDLVAAVRTAVGPAGSGGMPAAAGDLGSLAELHARVAGLQAG